MSTFVRMTLFNVKQVESEIMQLDASERQLFLDDLGVLKSGLEFLVCRQSLIIEMIVVDVFNDKIQATYQQLGLQTYFTTGKKETRAWTIRVRVTRSIFLSSHCESRRDPLLLKLLV